MINDRVLLKVSPIKGVMQIWKKGKLSLRFNSPFEILKKYGDVVYRLVLPLNLLFVHTIFMSL